jgi:hypothetical protein
MYVTNNHVSGTKNLNWTAHSVKILSLALVVMTMAGCVYEPYPGPPPPPPVVAAPPPVAYYGQPCCYAYGQYPPYYYSSGPNVELAFGHGGGYYHRWR